MSGSGGFQTQAFSQPAAFIAGNRTSQNPIFSYDAGPGGLVSGSSLFVGRFAWVTQPLDPNGTPSIANSFGAGAPDGFLMLNQQGLNTTFLSFAGMQVQPGAQTALQISGDFAAVNDGTTEAEYGQKAFAYVASGKIAFAAAGTVFGGASSTTAAVAASTFSVTGSIAGNLMTVTAVGSGTIVNGASVSGTNIPTGPKPQVLSQVTPLLAGETTGGVGRYNLNVGEITAASETISGTYGTLTLGGASTTPFAVGDTLTGIGVVTSPATVVTQILTGTGGGAGDTVAVNNNTVVSSTTITASVAVETKFFARSTGLPGEVVKISSTTTAGGL
jgi:hypothetical protein